MAIITLPSPVRIRRIDWSLDRPANVNVSAYTGYRHVAANPWHGKWYASVELAPMDAAAMRDWRAFLASLKGQINTFRLPAAEEGAQNANNGVTLAGSVTQGATVVTIGGYGTAMLPGQFITINNQLLVIVSVAGSNLTFEPPLRLAAAGGASVETSRPYAMVAMVDSRVSWSVDLGPIYGISFDVEEAQVPIFSPLDLFTAGTTGAWYDPSDLTSMWQDSAGTVAAAVNSPVGKINDKSGNAKHLSQATSAARPMLRQAGATYYLEFDGVDDVLVSSGTITLGDGWASSASYSNRARINYNGPWVLSSTLPAGPGNRLIGSYWSAGTADSGSWIIDRVAPLIFRQIDNAGPAVTVPLVEQIRKPVAATPSMFVYFTGGSDSTATASSGTQADLYPTGAGSLSVGVGYGTFAQQNFYGLTLLDRDLTDAEALDLRQYYALKAGITI